MGHPQSTEPSTAPYLTPHVWRQLGAMLLTKLADSMANPKTVLTWIMASIGAPLGLIGWLVPIRESLSMLPQIFMAAYLRRMPYRKSMWLLGAGVQGLAVGAMAMVALNLGGFSGGVLILAALILFSLGRALCSLTGKEILGKTVSRAYRGRVNGLAASAGGFLTMALGALGWSTLHQTTQVDWLVVPLFISCVAWGLAWLLFLGIQEPAGSIETSKTSTSPLHHTWTLLRTDHTFRHFLIIRLLMTGSALAGPYVVMMMHQGSTMAVGALGGLVVASALGSALSGWVWGHMADGSSRRVLVWASALAGLSALSLLLTRGWDRSSLFLQGLVMIAFFLLEVAHQGIRVGRKTFVLNLGAGVKRTDYIAISNSLIGLWLILSGLILSSLHTLPPTWILAGLGSMSLAGALGATTLPHLEKP